MYWHFSRWEQDKVTEQITAVLRRRVRSAAGREREPSAAIIDSQSVKGADTVDRTTRGYDPAKKINGRKRFIVTDPLGLLLVVCVMAASVQDRDGAKTTLVSLYLCAGAVRVRGRRLCRGAGGLDPKAVVHGVARCAQRPWPDRVRGDPAPVGGGASPGVVDRPSASGPGLRAASGGVRGDGALGRDRSDGPPLDARP